MNEDLKYCGKCGTPNPKDSVFCENCGNRFIETLPTEAVSQPPSAAPFSYTPPPYAPVSEPSSPPPRKFKKEYVIAAVAILAVLLIVGATAMVMSNSSSPSASPSKASASPSRYVSSPTLSVTPIPTLTPLPANAVIKRGAVGDTLSQGGVTATLLSYNKRAPGYVDTDGEVWNNTSYIVSLDMNKPAQYFSPSSNPQYGFVWSDNSSRFSNMGKLSLGDNSNTTYTGVSLASSRIGTTAYPVEFRMMLPTQSGDATYVFIWSIK